MDRRGSLGDGSSEDAPGAGRPLAALRIRLMGAFSVEVGGVRTPSGSWRSANARRLLAFLALHRGRAVPRDRICDVFWPDGDPASAERMFYAALRACRDAFAGLGEDGCRYVVRSGGGYRIAPEADAWVDVLAFEALARQVQARPPDEALPLVREAIALYGGLFLPDVHRCAWVDAWRSRLEQWRRDLLLCEARAHAARGERAEARRACYECLSEDPQWQEAWQLLRSLGGGAAQGGPG